jgi:hypothetical protein
MWREKIGDTKKYFRHRNEMNGPKAGDIKSPIRGCNTTATKYRPLTAENLVCRP